MLDGLLERVALDQLVFVLVMLGVFAGVALEQFRVWVVRRQYPRRKPWRRKTSVTPGPWRGAGQQDRPVTDASAQLRLVMAASFEARKLLNKSEARVFYAAERAIAAEAMKWRVMAQVNLGEILTTPDAKAFSAINSKRVDLLIISQSGEPLAAIEYQGSGHYQGTAPARDAVKKEALRKAGVRYIEMTHEHGPDDMRREVARMATVERMKGGVGSK